MSGLRSEALSALIDGALDPVRAAQVRAAIAADPELRAEYEMLVRLDGGLRMAADAAQFMPDIELPQAAGEPGRSHRGAMGLAVVTALLLVRLAPKFIEMAAFGWLLQIIAAGAILLVIVKMAGERDEDLAAAF